MSDLLKNRPDLQLIRDWIDPGSSVLDLGCGRGELLQDLRDHKAVEGYGLEIDRGNLHACLSKQLNVVESNLNDGLAQYFGDLSFDTVVMTATLQAMRRPDMLLQEMLRVGRQGIVTFPNMGYWRNRWQLGLGGHMPVTKTLPNEWYDTPNIHLCTLVDFEHLCDSLGIEVVQRQVMDESHRSNLWVKLAPNLMSQLAIYRIRLRQ